MRRFASFVCGAGLTLGLCWAAPALAAGTTTVLDETCTFRQYYRFNFNRYSAQLLKSDGEKILGQRGLDREKRMAERMMQVRGVDPAKADWRDHVYLAMGLGSRSFPPVPTPPVAADWMKPDFDDGIWVRKRRPFQACRPMTVTNIGLGQFDETMDLRLVQAYYRARFIVTDPAKATDLSLRVVYTGGVRVFLNGEEIARAHLSAGDLADDAPADPYPAAAYQPKGERLRNRTLAGVAIPRAKLRAGVNVLAVENRASHFHPVVMNLPTQPNWGGPMRPWAHAGIHEMELRGASAAVPQQVKRPAGVQAWVESPHHRVHSDDFLAPGEAPGTVRLVAARRGTAAAQIVIGTGTDLSHVVVTPSALRHAGAAGTIPASAFSVHDVAPCPVDRFTPEELGDERGLGAKFPTTGQLASLEATNISATICLFDHLIDAGSARIPRDAARPVWVSLRTPADAAPGTYAGEITVNATGMDPVRVQVEVEVVDWTLPEPKDFKTFVGCEENPYGVAKQYGVKTWSDEHFDLIETSFRQLGRIGNKWLNIPVLRDTEFGNGDDSMIKWTARRDGTFAFDFTTLDRYLDLAVKYCGRQRVVCFIVVHGMGHQGAAYTSEVTCFDERRGRSGPLALAGPKLAPNDKRARWEAFGKALRAHMKARHRAEVMWWGYPLEGEADPELKTILAGAVPDVFWVAGPHEMMSNGKFAKDERYYHLVADLRYQGRWPSFRFDCGWKSKTLHLNNPRAGGTCIALHTTSLPFGFRLLADRCLALGRNGFTRVGADDWAGVHYDGMTPPRWITGIPVLFTLWPGKDGAESSVRFESMLEGIQESEARIFIEQAVDGGKLPQALAARATRTLQDNFDETTFLQGNAIVQAPYENDTRWQERSRKLYRLAAEVAKALNRQ